MVRHYTLQTDVRMADRPDGRPDGWGGGYNNIPAFSSKSAGIKTDLMSCHSMASSDIFIVI